MVELFDTHCHIQSAGSSKGERSTRELWAKAGDTNVEAILDRARQADVTRVLCIGCDLEDSQLAVECAQQHDNCWASVGIHPHEAQKHLDEHTQAQFTKLAKQKKVVAVGECGLDYFYENSAREEQKGMLRFQIELALEHSLPIVLHVREAFDDFWPVFESYQSSARPIRGVLHSFTDSQVNLERALKHGLHIGVNGIATFTKSTEQQAMYRSIPLESLLLETDAPFLTPHPHRGTVCESYHIRVIAEFLAREFDKSVASLAEATTLNARRLFGV